MGKVNYFTRNKTIAEYLLAFPKELCDSIITAMKSDPNRKSRSELEYIESYEKDTFYEEYPHISKKACDITQDCLADYIVKTKTGIPIEGFSLHDMAPVENSKGLQEHVDPLVLGYKGAKLFRPVVCIVFLNDDYTGGDLVFPGHEVVITPEAGKLLIFPSHFSYPHLALTANRPRYMLKLDMILSDEYWSWL